MFKHLLIRRDKGVEHVVLNRPEVRNAFNEELIADLASWAAQVSGDRGVRAAVISGAGPVFCSGGDLNWMSRMAVYSHEENLRDATAAADMFHALDTLPFPVIARIHGAAMGGGTGVAAIADIAIALQDAVFGFTEVRLGLVPSLIAPYVLAKIGQSAARELFLTGARFDASRALEIGLVHRVCGTAGELDRAVQQNVDHVLASGSDAIAHAKQLIRQIANRPARDVAQLTVETIAARRASPEARARMAAFLQKRS